MGALLSHHSDGGEAAMTLGLGTPYPLTLSPGDSSPLPGHLWPQALAVSIDCLMVAFCNLETVDPPVSAFFSGAVILVVSASTCRTQVHVPSVWVFGEQSTDLVGAGQGCPEARRVGRLPDGQPILPPVRQRQGEEDGTGEER